ncbi:MAG: hypothetical protein R3E53_08350 [Myxococcota bacterium]
MKRTSSPETTRPRRSCGGNVRRDGARSGLVRDTGRRDRITRSLVACLTALATWATTASAAAAWLQVVEDFATGASSIESFPSPDDIAHEEPAGVFAATGIPTTETLGEQRTLVSLVHFTNDPSTPLLAVDVHADVFDLTNPSSTASYFQEVSYGRASISGSVQDWVSAGYADSACLVRGQTGTQQLVAALDPVIDFSQVDRWIVIIPPNPSCGFAGISSLGKWSFTTDEGTVRFSRIVLNGSSSPDLVAHELGHSLAGLQHSADLECVTAVVGTGCTELLSSDRYDTMGGTGHFSPPNKDALGWLANQVIGVSGAGGTYYLEPYETTGLGVKALRIPVRWPRDAYREVRNYYVSYRKPIGFDAIHPELATDGAMLHQDSFYRSDFYAATGASALLDAKPNIPATPDDPPTCCARSDRASSIHCTASPSRRWARRAVCSRSPGHDRPVLREHGAIDPEPARSATAAWLGRDLRLRRIHVRDPLLRKRLLRIRPELLRRGAMRTWTCLRRDERHVYGVPARLGPRAE